MKKKCVFVIGTDTGAGKTVLSLLLMHYFYHKGQTPFYIKPFQTGCDCPTHPDSDARLVYASLPPLQNKAPDASVIYCLKNAKAPCFAAKDQHTEIDMDKVYTFIQEKCDRYHFVIIEAAGGIFVPVTETTQIIDMVKTTGAFPVIAARAGLGTINHSLLTLDALKTRGIQKPGLVFIQQPDDPTPSDMIRENMDAVTRFSGVTVAGVIPPLQDFNHPDPALFEMFDRLFTASEG